jgi:hypothetical protein
VQHDSAALVQAMRRPIYLADPQTPNLRVHDHAWASKYSPAKTRAQVVFSLGHGGPGSVSYVGSVCDSTDGPGCMELRERYQSAQRSGVTLRADNSRGPGGPT